MKSIGNVASALAGKVSNPVSASASQQPLERATENAAAATRRQQAVDALFDAMRGIFGIERWNRERGEYDRTGVWAYAVTGLTQKDIERGLHYYATTPCRGLPTSAEFRATCLPPAGEGDMERHHCDECHRLLPYPGHRQKSFTGDRIVGRTERLGYICNCCTEKRPLPFSDVQRKLTA